MGRTALALRALGLATAVGGSWLLAVAAGAGPAMAAEEQLHAPSQSGDGLLFRGSGRLTVSEGRNVAGTSLARAQDITSPAAGGSKSSEPEIEEPGLPGYDSGAAQAAAAAR